MSERRFQPPGPTDPNDLVITFSFTIPREVTADKVQLDEFSCTTPMHHSWFVDTVEYRCRKHLGAEFLFAPGRYAFRVSSTGVEMDAPEAFDEASRERFRSTVEERFVNAHAGLVKHLEAWPDDEAISTLGHTLARNALLYHLKIAFEENDDGAFNPNIPIRVSGPSSALRSDEPQSLGELYPDHLYTLYPEEDALYVTVLLPDPYFGSWLTKTFIEQLTVVIAEQREKALLEVMAELRERGTSILTLAYKFLSTLSS